MTFSLTNLATALGIWQWRDLVEILFITTVLYTISRWLAHHVTKKLVLIMYGYCAILVSAYFLALPFVFNFLIVTAPAGCVLLFLMHQDTLQKNFIVPQRILPACREQSWIEALIQNCMIACSENKDIMIAIQHHDDISSFIKIGCAVDGTLHKSLLRTLMQSTIFDPQTFIYVRGDGTLAGINCSFEQISNKLASCEQKQISSWQDLALSLSAKTDALLLKSDHLNSTFTVILRGAISYKITAHACTQLVSDYVQDSSFSKKGYSHDIKTTNNSSEQHRA